MRARLLLLPLLLAGCPAEAPVDTPDPIPPWTPAFPGHRSRETLTTSNGLAVATVRSRSPEAGQAFNLVDRLQDHPYVRYDADTPSKDLLRSLYLGYRDGGAARWLLNVPGEAAYVPGTSIIRVRQEDAGRALESFVFAPFHAPGGGENQAHLLVVLLHVEDPQPGLTGLALLDLDLAQAADPHQEGVRAAGPQVVSESGGEDVVVYRNLASAGARATAGAAATAASPLGVTGPFGDGPLEAGPGGNVEVGMEAPLDAGGWFGLVLSHGAGQPAEDVAALVDAFVAGRGPQDILRAEEAFWSTWQARSVVPAGLHPYEEAVYRQSLAVLKMGQVREPGRGHGQLLASLVPGAWAISWVRDAAYAIMGLVRAGHLAEAKDALLFMLGAEMRRAGGRNFYQANFIERDLGVTLSAEYAISVTRYYGDGTEESDSNAAGPNIEFDNWGLFLWALAEYVEASGDDALLSAHWPTVSARVADLLVELIEPETGLLYPDSSIWERHWAAFGAAEPETRKHYAYSNICAYQGLKRAAALAGRLGDDARVTRYADASAGLAQAVLTRLVATPGGTGQPTVAGNLEELGDEVRYMDQAVVEAINTGLLADAPEVVQGTLAAFDHYLAIGPHSPGYFRNDDGTVYDQAEWVMIDLRTASALLVAGERARSKALLDWVTDQARHNYGLIPELYGPGDGDYNANTPMCGFGPGAYVMALSEYFAP
jgi:GH15 family glucan-1,4-alpha-glucosidase